MDRKKEEKFCFCFPSMIFNCVWEEEAENWGRKDNLDGEEGMGEVKISFFSGGGESFLGIITKLITYHYYRVTNRAEI